MTNSLKTSKTKKRKNEDEMPLSPRGKRHRLYQIRREEEMAALREALCGITDLHYGKTKET